MAENRLSSFWRRWRPQGSWKRILALCLLGWFLLNASYIFWVGAVPVFPISEKPWWAKFVSLSGIPWVMAWHHFWPWLPLRITIFVGAAWLWLRRPNLVTAAILAVTGMATGPAAHLFGSMALFSLAFALFMILCAWLLQIVWNNWDAPAPTEEEKSARKALRASKWPLRKKFVLILIPFAIYSGSAWLCALGGSFRQLATLEVRNCSQFHGTISSKSWKISSTKLQPVPHEFTMTNLVRGAWINGDFSEALLGEIPESLNELVFSFMGLHRFAFVLFFSFAFLVWFWRPSWLFYFFICFFFFIGVNQAKSSLTWQFYSPVYEHPELKGKTPPFLELWSKYSPV